MTLLILYGLLAVGVSFLCSLLEACLLSIPRSYVEALVQGGARFGPMLRDMKTHIDRPLAAILTLNTVAHTFGAAGVGAQAAVVFGSAAVGAASVVMTLLVLVVSEIIPKTLGAVHAKRLAGAATVTIRGMIVLCLPVVIPLEWLNRLIAPSKLHRRLSRAELLANVRLGKTSGALDPREFQIVTNLIALADVRLSDVMTPRTVVFSLPQDLTVKEVFDQHRSMRFARIPVYAGDAETITGYVPRFALYDALAAGRLTEALEDLTRPIPILPALASVDDTLQRFLREGQHIGLVVDEYGGMAGIITLEDLLETLLGEEIVDETDEVADMQELARARIRKRRHSE